MKLLESPKVKERLLSGISLLSDKDRIIFNYLIIKINENAELSYPETKVTKKPRRYN
jgi:hypothetical protein